MYQEITACRVCDNHELVEVLNLGNQALTGVFPANKQQPVASGPLTLVKCFGADSKKHCGLLQLKHTYQLSELYGDNYGYRSGLNASMVKHLHEKVKKIMEFVALQPNDILIDIGSNDATTLKAYPKDLYRLIGVDPTGSKFKEYYPSHIELIADFFNVTNVKKIIGEQKVKVITSFSMFYDLPDPVQFAKEIQSILTDDGIWVFEQSYMPEMLRQNSFDTICHEHLEYYGLQQIQWIADQAGLKIIDVEFNDVNGGSFSVVAAKQKSKYLANIKKIDAILADEKNTGLNGLLPYQEFMNRIEVIKQQLIEKIKNIKENGETIYGIGASTKGNVLLQYCNITEQELPLIGEVNDEKFNKFTPGTVIPIVSEAEILAKRPDYLLILPWHFRDFFENNAQFKMSNLLFPLPMVSVHNKI